MQRFIHGERNGIYLIDLNKTLERITEAYSFVRDTVAEGGMVLFVGTKKQNQDAVKTFSQNCGQPYVNQRWLGGMLTNFETMAKRVAKMKEYQRMQDTGAFDEMPKKEALMLSRELAKLERNLSGISMLKERPQVVFVLDTKKEHIAVTEANKLRIPVIAVVDTNCDPDVIDFVIPGNDDAIRSGELMCRVISEAVEEGQLIRAKKQGSQTVKEEEPVKEVEQQEAQKEATADFQEREKKVATEIATIPEQETEESAEEQGES